MILLFLSLASMLGVEKTRDELIPYLFGMNAIIQF